MSECHKCGACCTVLIVEAEPLDALREPRIAEVCGLPAVPADCYELDEEADEAHPRDVWSGGVAVLAPRFGEPIDEKRKELLPCPFLADRRCSIYPTRPNCCVAFAPGSEACQNARELAAEVESITANLKRKGVPQCS